MLMMDRLPDFKLGDKFGRIGAGGVIVLERNGARILNAIGKELVRLGRWTRETPIEIRDTTDGRHLSVSRPIVIWALLTGTSSPYDFVEVEPTSGGGFAPKPGGFSGAACAYEANGLAGVAGPDGSYVQLEMVSGTDWRFYWYRWGGTSSDCLGSFICVQISAFCYGRVAGATTPNLDGTVVSITGPGSYSDTWTISQPGSYAAVSHCFGRVPAGTYTITITANSSYSSPTAHTVTVDGCNNKNISIGLYPAQIPVIVAVGECACNPNPTFSYPITVSGGGGSCVASTGALLGSSASCTYMIPRPANGTAITFTASATNFITQTVTQTVDFSTCELVVSLSLDPVGNPYAFCFPNDACVRPFPTTLTLTFDSSWGPWAGTTGTATLHTSGAWDGWYVYCAPYGYGSSAQLRFVIEGGGGCGQTKLVSAVAVWSWVSDCTDSPASYEFGMNLDSDGAFPACPTLMFTLVERGMTISPKTVLVSE